MSNNYSLFSTRFSQIIPNLTKEEVSWLKGALRPDWRNWDKEKADDFCVTFGLRDYGDASSWPGFNYKFQPHELWIYSEDSGNVENTVSIIQEFLSLFRPNDCFSMNWAETCGKPRIEEFGGGAVFITKDDARYMDTWDWVRQQKEEWNARKDPPKGDA